VAKLPIFALVVVLTLVGVATATLANATPIHTTLAGIALIVVAAFRRLTATLTLALPTTALETLRALVVVAAAIALATTLNTLTALANLALFAVVRTPTSVAAATLNASSTLAGLTVFAIICTAAAARRWARHTPVVAALKSLTTVRVFAAFLTDIFAHTASTATDFIIVTISITLTTPRRRFFTRNTPQIFNTP
jgi:hypothetical protein